jgi:hypothetical protein
VLLTLVDTSHSIKPSPLLLYLQLSRSMCRYLSQSGPLHPKHGGGSVTSTSHASSVTMLKRTILPPLHPTLAFIVHYSIVISSTLLVHDHFFASINNTRQPSSSVDEATLRHRQHQVATFAFIYVVILFGTRYLSSYQAGRLRQHAVLYELTWLCNSTLVMGWICFGGIEILNNYLDGSGDNNNDVLGWFGRRRPLVATSFCVGASIDQVLWYVDLIVWTITGTFPVGVMKYLTWKQTLWIDRLTCTHHMWTIPLFTYAANEMTLDSYLLSVYVVTIHVLLSRWLTPYCIQIGDNANIADTQLYRYLNVNLSHELWRDISFGFLQISEDDPPCWLYLFRLLWRWNLFNFLVFVGVLSPLHKLIND